MDKSYVENAEKITYFSLMDRCAASSAELGKIMQEYKSTSSEDVAGALIGTLRDCWRQGLAPEIEAASYMFELVETLNLESMSPELISGLLGTVDKFLQQSELPACVNLAPLAKVIANSLFDESLSRDQRILLGHAATQVCVGLAIRDLLPRLLASLQSDSNLFINRLNLLSQEIQSNPDMNLYFGDTINDVLEELASCNSKE
jgi:hypothetical protein